MNVRVHRPVIVAGEHDPRELAKLRNPRCHKSVEEIAEQLSGHWREDHLFSLQQSLKMYEAIQKRIAAYDCELLRKLAENGTRRVPRARTAEAEQPAEG